MDPVLLRLSSMVSDSVLVMLSRFSSMTAMAGGFEVSETTDSLVGLLLDPDTFLSLALKSKGSDAEFAAAASSSAAVGADGNVLEGFFNFTLKSTTTTLLLRLLS